MDQDIAAICKEKMAKTINVMQQDFGMLRAGRANAQILERIMVDYYGTPTPINQLGNIAIPEPRLLVINVWDQKAIKDIEKAIQASDIGINPNNDGKSIRLVFPELTEERRKDLTKTVAKRAEDAKVACRSIRRDANDTIKKMQKSSEITEDDQKLLEKEIQEITDEKIKQIDKLAADKSKEIMSV